MKKVIPLILLALVVAGCATTAQYVAYTSQKYPAKSGHYFISVYPGTTRPPASEPYTVIGKVQVTGYASDGVTPLDLTERAKAIARKKGADAIIKAQTTASSYSDVYVEPGFVTRHRFFPPSYIPVYDTLLTFSGDLIVFSPRPPPPAPTGKKQ